MSEKSGLTAWERWELASFDEAAVAVPAPVASEVATTEAAGPVPPAPTFAAEEIEALKAEAREQAYAEGREAGEREGHTEGREAGLAEGLAEARIQGEAQVARLASLVETLEARIAAIDEVVAEDLLALALAIARGVIGQQMNARPELVAATVRQALQHLPVQHANIQVHPDDLALVKEHASDALAHGAHRLHENLQLARGDVIVDAGGSHLDATLAERWQRVLATLARCEPLAAPEARNVGLA